MQRKNTIVQKIRQVKQHFYLEKIDEAKNDSKEMWKVLRELTNNEAKLSQKNGDLFRRELNTDNKIIAEKFTNYFIDSIKEITSPLPCNKNTHIEFISEMDQVICCLYMREY